ncbi:MAG TPA: polysaccharide biosynthesis/export family protein [Thermoanaerobaculia bacterium]|nr:polysaccharide biosynthesis/export family protein [Thermoanaerobaculia bacterium]
MKKIAVLFPVVLSLCVAFTPAGAQSQGGEPSEYRVGPRDLLEIRVFEDEQLNGRRRVSEAGTIDLPPLGEVSVSGKTPAEIGQVLKEKLEARYMQRASVNVQVAEFRSRPISVIGAVKQPGNLAFSGRWTLLEALTAAGGLAENHGNVVYVLRRTDNGLSDQVAVSLNELLVRANPKVNIPIFANDLINVPATIEVIVYCLGEVGRPGALAFKSSERITVLAAIAHAGGLTDRASNKILVKRAGATGPREITVDYKKLVAGREPDIELRQGDVIIVKESFF